MRNPLLLLLWQDCAFACSDSKLHTRSRHRAHGPNDMDADKVQGLTPEAHAAACRAAPDSCGSERVHESLSAIRTMDDLTPPSLPELHWN